MCSAAPPSGSVEAAALAYLTSESMDEKLTPPGRGLPVSGWRHPDPASLRPGRPPELTVVDSAPKTPRSVRRAEARTLLVHTFLHHELQAAELFCWAVLRFPDTPEDFRRGLLALCRDEVRHMGMYRDYLADHGVAVGDHPVRDWFWLRVPHCDSPAAFVATLGIGFEGGNLDHTQRFAQMFRAAGDEAGAALQEQVGREEVAHVRFAWRWFERFSADGSEESLDRFAAWAAALPSPLSPMLMKGKSLHRGARRRAGLDDAFMDRLAAYRGQP